MEEGVLCLKWRDHRSTFLHMLSSIRKKGMFCDVTLVCEGKFYPVHRLVLSTCSEYFQQMFEDMTSGTTGPPNPSSGPLIIVLMGISARDLEALLEYMYAGEASILQRDLLRFMKAAEGFKVRGLAEPPPSVSSSTSTTSTSTSRRESGEDMKRTLPHREDRLDTKRKKECVEVPKVSREKEAATPEIVSPAQLACVQLGPDTQQGMERDMATGTPGDLPAQTSHTSSLSHTQIKYEELHVKDEPQDVEEMEEEKEQRHLSFQQQQQQHHKGQKQTSVVGEEIENCQVFGACDPGLTYLANTTGLGLISDQAHSSHAPWNNNTIAASESDNFSPQTAGHMRNVASQRRMGRPTSEIWLHYTTERAAGRTAVYCCYCSQKYGYPNATKMKIHTVKCTKCPEEVRRQFESTVKPELSEAQDGTPARLNEDVTNKTDSYPQYQSYQSQLPTDRPTEYSNSTLTSKSASQKTQTRAQNPSNSKPGLETHNPSLIKLQNVTHQDPVEICSASKPQPEKCPNPLKGTNSSDVKQSTSLSSPETIKKSPSNSQQHSRPFII